MNSKLQLDEPLAALASHLAVRRAAILQAWRNAVDNDPQLNSAASLPRVQLNDHIPHVLDAFERGLRAPAQRVSAAATADAHEDAAAHGLHRWQQGYHLREVTREWGHLQLTLADELENFARARSDLGSGVMASAYRALAQMSGEGVSDSTARYFQLQQIEAAGQVRDLEKALEEVRELEHRRAELWRQAAHDLRGNLGVVANVTAGLTLETVPESIRENFLRLLKKNVSSLHAMLEDVTSLARLQAGQEQRDVKVMDAGLLLVELCENLQPVAKERGLYVHAEGATEFVVEGDAVKIRRIIQNLLLNAVKYTHRGGVTVRWGDSRENDPERWMVSVEDTGPGFHAGPGAPLAGALEVATEESREVEQNSSEDTGKKSDPNAQAAARTPADSRPIHQEQGEGIGLSIVKRLSELLDASMELVSKPGQGTIIRLVLPRHYRSPNQPPTGPQAT